MQIRFLWKHAVSNVFKLLLFAGLTSLSNTPLQAQTSFGLGEIAITGYQADTPDRVSLVFLKDVEAGTTFQITDNGWDGDNGDFRAGEGIETVTISTALSCGTEVVLILEEEDRMPTEGQVQLVDGTVVGELSLSSSNQISLSSTGDQFFIYQGSTTPEDVTEDDLITGIQMNGAWETSFGTSGQSNKSFQPTVFVNGENSFFISPERDNAYYNCGISSGTPEELAAAINTYDTGLIDNPNDDTWITSNDLFGESSIPTGCEFTCEAACEAPMITCPEGITYTECNPMIPAADIALPEVEGGCGDVTVSHVGDLMMDDGCTRTITRTYRATDEDDQTADCTQVFTFTFDEDRPQFTNPEDMTISLDANPEADCPYDEVVSDIAQGDIVEAGADFMIHGVTFQAPTDFSDNCPGDLSLSVFRFIEEFDGSDEPCTRVIRIRWRVTDACGLFRTRDQLFTIIDDRKPEFSPLEDQTILLSENPDAICPYPESVTDLVEDFGNQANPVEPGSDFMIHGVTFQAPSEDLFTDNCTDELTLYAHNIIEEFEGSEDPCVRVMSVRWRVYDDCDNFRQRRQEFTIIDDVKPTFTKPADQTIEVSMTENVCPYPDADISLEKDMDLLNPITPGSEFTVHGVSFEAPLAETYSDNCDEEPELFVWNIIEEATGTSEPCTRVISVRWRVYDNCGNFRQRRQDFTITIVEGPQIAVVPTLTANCFEGINPNPAFASVQTTCDVPFSTVAELIGSTGVTNCPGATYTYRYTVTDACGRSASADQVYTIDNENPTMECPDNCEVFSCYEGDYNDIIDAWLNTVTATSSCSDELIVTNTFNGIDGICVGDFTPVFFYATDDCGRTATCESGIFIVDTDAPEIEGTPTEVIVPCTANTQSIFNEWLANHGGVSAYDACGGNIFWSVSVGSDALDCANGPQAILVEFTATDGCGNSSSVMGTFNTKILPNMVNVSGSIQTEAAQSVANVQVGLYSPTAGLPTMDMSTAQGNYAFPEVEYEENLTIEPAKNNDLLNGISTLDLILLQQHILGINELNSPYKQIAADINRSGAISTIDMVLLRRAILHIDEEFADNTSWRFVDADFVFPNAANPFETEFPEIYELGAAEEELANFVAVKIGDLNLDAETNGLTSTDDRTGLENLVFSIEDQKLSAGQTYTIDVTAENFEAIRGFQLTWNIDHSLVYVLEVESGALSNLNEANYNLAFANEGLIPMSWNHQSGQDLSFGDVAFRIIVKANADVNLSEAIAISSSLTKAEAYNESELRNVSLNFTNNGATVQADPIAIGFQLFQNQPNPFKAATNIGFVLPEAGEVTLEIYDVAGKVIHVERGDYAKGYHQIDLDRANLPSGILYYNVSTATDSDAKKMILID